MTTDRGTEWGTSNQGITGDSLKGYNLKEREGYNLKVIIYYKKFIDDKSYIVFIHYFFLFF